MTQNSTAKVRKNMNPLSNAFSILTTDDDDDQFPPPSTSGKVLAAEQSGEMGDTSTAAMVAENRNQKDTNIELPSGEFEQPLVWIDLEMTGLNVEVDRILEIACIVTDGSLTKSVEGPDLAIHQTQECLDKMGEWCQDHHGASGLTKKVLKSTITEKEAEKQVIKFVKEHVGNSTPLLAGNSVYTDLIFLKKYMPELASLFPQNLVDVSSIKCMCVRWYPRAHRKGPAKEQRHRALDDIRESIAELKYYKEAIFKPQT